VLHGPAAPVSEITPDIHRLIDDMVQTMYAAPGIGLAATQVGVPLRIFVADLSAGNRAGELITFINPELWRSRARSTRTKAASACRGSRRTSFARRARS